MECIFCRIVQKQLPAEIYYEDEDWMAIKDIQPQAPYHLLFISKQHIADYAALDTAQLGILTSLHHAVSEVATQLQLTSYRLICNNGAAAGQSVAHLHWHLVSGMNPEHLC